MAHYREAHPLPFVITHWVNLVAMIFLILTGFYIHYPLFGGVMSLARGLHIFFGIVLLLNCVVRMVLAFFIKSAPAPGTRELVMDYKTWLPQRDNKHQLWAWISYYLFLRRDHPIAAKLGVPQKIVYLLIPLLIFFTGYTGFCLWGVTANWGFFAVGMDFLGGPMKVRILHFCPDVSEASGLFLMRWDEGLVWTYRSYAWAMNGSLTMGSDPRWRATCLRSGPGPRTLRCSIAG